MALNTRFGKAAASAPSLIVLDDLDSLVPPYPQEHSPPVRSMQIVEYISDLLSLTLEGRHRIVIVSTSQTLASVHPSILRNSSFAKEIPITLPKTDLRAQILAHLFSQMNVTSPALFHSANSSDESLDIPVPMEHLTDFCKKCEGYSPRDLIHLTHRAVHAAVASRVEEAIEQFDHLVERKEDEGKDGKDEACLAPIYTTATPLLKLSHLEEARESYTPISLKGITPPSQSVTLTWSDLGGLHNIRRVAEEMYEWPFKHPDLYRDLGDAAAACGLLLYGPPGCGKTMIAQIIANEYKVRGGERQWRR